MKLSNALHLIAPLVLATSFGALAQSKDNKIVNKAEIFKASNTGSLVNPKSSSPVLGGKSPLSNKMGLKNGLSRPQGGVATGGGDAYSQNFVQTGWAIYNELLMKGQSGISLPALKNAILTVDVVSTEDKLFLNGDEKDALNEPTLNQIKINRQRWQETEQPRRKAIALHEYLRFLRIDDSNYQVSGPLLAGLAQDPTSQVIDALEDMKGQANVILSRVGNLGSEATCYDIAMLNLAIGKFNKLIKARGTLPKKFSMGLETERLNIWSSVLRNLCYHGKAPTPAGVYVEASDKSYKEFLLLVMRESEILLSWTYSQTQNIPFEQNEIWDRYKKEISNL